MILPEIASGTVPVAGVVDGAGVTAAGGSAGSRSGQPATVQAGRWRGQGMPATQTRESSVTSPPVGPCTALLLAVVRLGGGGEPGWGGAAALAPGAAAEP